MDIIGYLYGTCERSIIKFLTLLNIEGIDHRNIFSILRLNFIRMPEQTISCTSIMCANHDIDNLIEKVQCELSPLEKRGDNSI